MKKIIATLAIIFSIVPSLAFADDVTFTTSLDGSTFSITGGNLYSAWYADDGYTSQYGGNDTPITDRLTALEFGDISDYKFIIANAEDPGNFCSGNTYQECVDQESIAEGQGGTVLGYGSFSVILDGTLVIQDLDLTVVPQPDAPVNTGNWAFTYLMLCLTVGFGVLVSFVSGLFYHRKK